MNPDLARIVVVGPSGAGKTVFARQLAALLAVPHVEVDALRRQANDKLDIVLELAEKALAQRRWILDGNRPVVLGLAWPQATAVILLNYPFPLVLWRRLRRTRNRIRNPRNWTLPLFVNRLRWTVSRVSPRWKRRHWVQIVRRRYPQVAVLEFQSPRQAAAFLRSLSATAFPALQEGTGRALL